MTLEYISPKGDIMPLTGSQYFTLTEIDGFTVAQSEISSVVIPFVDGDTITNQQTNPRSIILYFKLKRDIGIENAKRYILRFVKLKQQGRIHLVQNGRDIELAGTVEAVDLPRFGEGCTMAVTLHCSQPYWKDVDFVVREISQILNLHYFPIEEGGLAFPTAGVPFGSYDTDLTQELENEGDVETGMIINIIALGEVVNPKIINTYTGEYIGVNDTLEGNDSVVITTVKGQKSITKNGVNIINKIMTGSTFLQLVTGANEYTIQADSGIDDVYFTLTYKRLYI